VDFYNGESALYVAPNPDAALEQFSQEYAHEIGKPCFVDEDGLEWPHIRVDEVVPAKRLVYKDGNDIIVMEGG
jgi:hypothetical protein